MGCPSQPLTSPWPHRLAVALALVTFPLIWVGGLVTTYDAGMAVPDWPGTYGYNLFRYPWQTWLAGPWDLFIEHGHRLLGAIAGLLSISLVATVMLYDRRKWLVAMSFGAVGLVIVQGVLGGVRVLLDERLVAMLHGCVGPLFFAYLAGLIVATSRWWQAATPIESSSGYRFARTAWMTAGVAYIQLIFGALLRHVSPTAGPTVFRAALLMHLIVAAGVTLQVLFAVIRAHRLPQNATGLRMPGQLAVALVLGQLLLGVSTYVAKYAFPAWLGNYQFAAAFVIQEKSLAQSLVTTAHVATGSLILFVTVVLASRSARLFFGRAGIISSRNDWQTVSAPRIGAAA
jgi:cytochrome c oxidase assembly protein subunit 15